MKTQLRKWILLTLTLATGFALSACNTTRGLGEDVEDLGDEIQDATN